MQAAMRGGAQHASSHEGWGSACAHENMISKQLGQAFVTDSQII